MKKAIIYLFSGTGNTRYVANSIKTELTKQNTSTDIVEVSRPFSLEKQPSDYDIIGFGYPIHAFNCPKIMVDFVQALKICPDKYTFIFKTSGEPFKLNNASSYLLKNVLITKGISINYEQHILMPYNIMFRYNDHIVKQMLIYMHALTKVLAIKITNRSSMRIKYNIFHILTSFIFRVQWGGAVLNGRLYHVNKKKCINCDLCIKSCPTKNISRNTQTQTIKFNGSCVMCMRCAMDCPKSAISIGILSLWKVNGAYPFGTILSNKSLNDTFVTKNTKGYFRLFNPYFKKSKALCDNHRIEI